MVRYTTVDDVGVAVNPMLVTGQVHGGVAQGIGQALYEGVAYSEEGQLLTASYQDYCVPRADDIPPIAVTLDDSAPCRTNPLGAKGCGESGAIGGPPCVTNGVMDALSELGIKQLNTPLTPAKVWQAIRDAKAAGRKGGRPPSFLARWLRADGEHGMPLVRGALKRCAGTTRQRAIRLVLSTGAG